MAIVDDFTKSLEILKQPIAIVMKSPPGPRRWRVAHDLLWRDASPRNQKIYKEVTEENRLTREAADKFGFDKHATKEQRADKTLRNYLNIPIGAYQTIEKADPGVFKAAENAKKFFETFPEYATREIW